jgi:hypothetical protein
MTRRLNWHRANTMKRPTLCITHEWNHMQRDTTARWLQRREARLAMRAMGRSSERKRLSGSSKRSNSRRVHRRLNTTEIPPR